MSGNFTGRQRGFSVNLSDTMRFLEKKLGTMISIEVRDPVFYQCESLKLAPDQFLHHSAFCVRKKMADENRTCSRSKMECMKRCTSPEPFLRTCPFNVTELVTPIMKNGRLHAAIFFGVGKSEAECRRYSAFLAEWILLELESVMSSGLFSRKQRSPEFYVESCLHFIESHYMDNITLTDLTEFLHVNPNYLGGLLKKRLGKNFHALLTERRIREAKVYLRLHRSLTVGYIGTLCGFSDGNYFSLVFRKHCGISPGQFRKAPLPE